MGVWRGGNYEKHAAGKDPGGVLFEKRDTGYPARPVRPGVAGASRVQRGVFMGLSGSLGTAESGQV
jgi:hypothetical protein